MRRHPARRSTRRPLLLSTLALGIVATGLASSGTWAVFDDSARSEDIAISSGEVNEGQDIRIANLPASGLCPTDPAAYRDGNEAFDPIVLEYNADSTLDGTAYQEALTTDLCVRNFGHDAVTLGLSTDILLDDDPYCSDLEPEEPGTTCGQALGGDPTDGELDSTYTLTTSHSQLHHDGTTTTSEVPCSSTGFVGTIALGGQALPIVHRSGPCNLSGSVEKGETWSFHLSLAYNPPAGAPLRTPLEIARRAQSDRLTFRYVIGATKT